MGWLEVVIEILRKDPKRGPRLFLGILLGAMLWIAFMQGIDADLWYEHGYNESVSVEDMK